MSAIVGMARLDERPVSAAELQPLMDGCAHYGGEGAGIWTAGTVGLGHHQRHDTPESEGEQMPLTWQGLTITADARIDNRDDLLSVLAVATERRPTFPDSLLILMAYQKWGDGAPAHLVGDFAFALWDAARHRLLCARDQIGIRPLFYFHNPVLFAFSSDLDALLALPGVPVEADEEFIIDLLSSGRLHLGHKERTLYNGFRRLPIAHIATVQAKDVSVRPYWEPQFGPALDSGVDELSFEQVRALVERAVRDRLRTAYSVGAHLSGGLDSSSVAILAARHLHAQGRQLLVYSWSPPAGPNPSPDTENYRIEAICRQEGLTPQYVPPGSAQPVSSRSRNGNFLDSEDALIAQASAAGVRLMLSGWGGDEFASFNGRGYRADLFSHGRWAELLGTFDWSRFPRGLISNLRLLWRDTVLVFGPDWLYRLSESDHGSRRTPRNLLRPEFARRVGAVSRRPAPQRYQAGSVKQTQAELFQGGHLQDRIERWHARAAGYGIAYAYPLLDRRLLEYVWQLPDRLFLRRSQTRFLYRSAIAPLLPPHLTTDKRLRMKSEPRLAAHVRALEHVAHGKASHGLPADPAPRPDNPWVDVAELGARMADNRESHSRDNGLSSGNALMLIQLWNQLCTLREHG